MRIDKLQLKNFRGYVDQSFEFHPQFNLIIGENASGKTSLLEGLERACSSFFLGISGQETSPIGEDDVRRKVILQGDKPTIEGQYPVQFLAYGFISNTKCEWSRSLSDKGRRTNWENAKTIQKIAEECVRKVRAGDEVALPLFSHYGSGRLWVHPKDMRGAPKDDEKPMESRLDGYRFSNDPRINVADLMHWFKDERYVSLELGKDRFGFAAAKSAMKSCLPDCLSLDYSTVEKTLVIELESKGQLPFHLLSDGQRIMLALVADIAFKAAQLNPHLEDRALQETSGVVLIDELDLHLHPRWQRHVVTDLKKTFPKIQFFATTHSPQLIGETPPEEIILLRKDGSWTRPKQTVGLSSNQILADVMGADVINQEMQQKFDDVFRLVEEGKFSDARIEISKLREGGRDFPELHEAEGYMSSISSEMDE